MEGRNTHAKDGGAAGQSDRTLFIIMYMLIVAAAGTALFFAIVTGRVIDLTALRKERAALMVVSEDFQISNNAGNVSIRAHDTDITAIGSDPGVPAAGASDADLNGTEDMTADVDTGVPAVSAFDAKMREINADYLCWLKIDGTAIDYPVVRGTDNEKYLHTSFYGDENWYGALFMDYRNTGGHVPHIIIYGHNAKTGDMFGGLRKFLDVGYRENHPMITVKANDRIVQFEIFAARKTDINDPAYFLDFGEAGSFAAFTERCGAPAGTAQIITLSTCVSAGDDDERVIVQGALR